MAGLYSQVNVQTEHVCEVRTVLRVLFWLRSCASNQLAFAYASGAVVVSRVFVFRLAFFVMCVCVCLCVCVCARVRVCVRVRV